MSNNTLSQLDPKVVDGWFERRDLKPFEKSHHLILSEYVNKKIYRTYGANFIENPDDVLHEIIIRLKKALKTIHLVKSGIAALTGIINYHLPFAIAKVKKGIEGKPLPRPFGLTLSDRKPDNIDSSVEYGVWITLVESNSAGNSSGILNGDQLIKIDGNDVNKSKDAVKLLKKHTGTSKKLTLKRGAETVETELKDSDRTQNGLARVETGEAFEQQSYHDSYTDAELLKVIAAKEALQAIEKSVLKEIVERHYIDNLSYKKIYESDPDKYKSVVNVRVNARRGLKKLFENLEKYAEYMLANIKGVLPKKDVEIYKSILRDARECKKQFKNY